jgi:hypothetical protein
MLCVPRSWAASPCVIERTTVSLFMIFAMLTNFSPTYSPGTEVLIGVYGPR